MKMQNVHQGDVYLKPAKLPQDAILHDDAEDGKVILALGEATGHHHRFETPNVLMFHANDNTGRRFVLISQTPAVLLHEEHAPIECPPGTYEVFIARQWSDDEEPIAVVD